MELKVLGMPLFKDGEISVEVSPLTLIVGPQGAGKSLLMETIYLGIKGVANVLGDMQKYGLDVDSNDVTHVRFFYRVEADFVGFSIKSEVETTDSVFYVPSLRSALYAMGYFPDFITVYKEGYPYVIAKYSDEMKNFMRMAREGQWVFAKKYLEEKIATKHFDFIREQILRSPDDGYLFPEFRRKEEMIKVLVMKHSIKNLDISYSRWSTGQRESIPLLLSILMRKWDYLLIEEPELGLHTKGILAVIRALLYLIQKGHTIIMSTHSPFVMDVVWALVHTAKSPGVQKKMLKEIFDIDAGKVIRPKVYYVESGSVKDISGLDVSKEPPEATAGDIWKYSIELGNYVAEAVGEATEE